MAHDLAPALNHLIHRAMIALDAADGDTGSFEHAELAAELATLLGDFTAAQDDPLAAAELATQMEEVLAKLGALLSPVAEPKADTEQHYDYREDITKSARQRENNAAVELLRDLQASKRTPTDDEKAALAKYSGTGGGLIRHTGKVGSPFEYYTPKPIAQGVWDMLADIGFTGGRVLDPSAGTGIFGATAPKSAAIDAIELDEVSGGINAVLNAGPSYSVKIASFEEIAGESEDGTHDAVVTNVPFGDVSIREHAKKDSKYRRLDLGPYFALRSLDKLKPGGLAAFITPHGMMDGKGEKLSDFRRAASLKAEFLGAYRLPNKVFDSAGADVLTDVMVWRKFSRDAAERIAECREQSPDTLTASNVLWEEFISGNYFKETGRKFVLGTIKMVASRWSKDELVEAVESDASLTDIAKIMRKFGPSRIDWAALDAAETLPISYAEGDTLFKDGVTLQFTDGAWVPVSATDEAFANEMDGVGLRLTGPLEALLQGVTWQQMHSYGEYRLKTDDWAAVPDWARGPFYETRNFSEGGREGLWRALIVGSAIRDAREQHAQESGFSYETAYAELHTAIAACSGFASKAKPKVQTKGSKETLAEITTVYTAKAGYAGWWTGEVAAPQPGADDQSAEATFERLSYGSGSGVVDYIPISTLKASDPNFDPYATDEWCVSGDGQRAMRADDYYYGKLSDFYARVDADIAACGDETVRAKLIRQRNNIASRIVRADPKRINFNLSSPFVTDEEKLAFAQQYLHRGFNFEFDENGGRKIKVDLDSAKMPNRGSEEYVTAKALELFWNYFDKGTFAMRGMSGLDEATKERIVKKMRELATTATAQFNLWAKSNRAIQARLEGIANDPSKAFFRRVENTTAFDIPGCRTDLIKPHGYQFGSIRRFGRDFSGILGDGVGLGKTSQALWTMQHVHNIGVKKKTIVVVPKSVLLNWKREAGRIYEDMNDCLFVGLTATIDGKTGAKMMSRGDGDAVRRDLKSIANGRARKVFMTLDDFGLIPTKEQTLKDYLDYIRSLDSAFASQTSDKGQKRVDTILANFAANFDKQDTSITYFEDMGVDSVVVDEAHALKASRMSVDFEDARFLATPEVSNRGAQAQVKFWWLRSGQKDGVLCLTATPVTNSPLEIYSMLSLSLGEEVAQDMLLGVKGADEFLNTFCATGDEEEKDITGAMKVSRTFVGIQNLALLRNVLDNSMLARTSESVGNAIVVPTRNTEPVSVVLPKTDNERLKLYADAYKGARESMKPKGNATAQQLAALKIVMQETGLPMALLAHPFNMINRVERLIMDKDLDAECTRYTIPRAQAQKAIAAVEKFNKSNVTEERTRHTRLSTDEDMVKGSLKITLNDDGDEVSRIFKVYVRAYYLDAKQAIEIDTMDFETQAKFLAITEKAGIDLDGSVSPKIAALLENIQKENETPRNKGEGGVSRSKAKQLIFCDSLAMHHKIKMLIARRCGVPKAKITFISAPSAPNPEDVQNISDGFNADGDANQFQIIICNKKAEVGINLQKGCQAIHMLTLGWTPDSVEQRIGRGVRQGNETPYVNLYFYEAEGTFDKYRRMLVNRKGDWINDAMTNRDADVAESAGELSAAQQDALMETIGDADAAAKFQKAQADSDAAQRKSTRRARQLVALKTIDANLAQSAMTYAGYVVLALQKARLASASLEEATKRVEKAKTPAAANKIKLLADERAATLKGLSAQIDDAYTGGIDVKRLTYRGEALSELIYRSGTRESDLESGIPNEGSSLYQEWLDRSTQSQELLRQASNDYKATAAQGGGAYSEATLNAYTDGEAQLVGGQLVRINDLCRTASGVLVIVRKSTSYSSKGLTAMRPDTLRSEELAAVLAAGGVILDEGSAEYAAAVSEAAAIDDATAPANKLDASSGESARSVLFSSYIPAVASQMRYVLPMILDTAEFKLPSPHYPQFLREPRAGSVFHAAWRAQSAAGFKEAAKPGYFEPPAGVECEQVGRYELLEQCAAVLWDMVGSGQLSLEEARQSGLSARVISQEALRRDPAFGGMVQGLKESDFQTVDAVDDYAASAMAAAVPIITTANLIALSSTYYRPGTLADVLPDDIRDLLRRRKEEVNNGIRRKQIEAETAQREQDAIRRAEAEKKRLEETAQLLTDGPAVGIVWNFTDGMKEKEKLKALATSMGTMAYFSKPPAIWTVARKVYEKMLIDYPASMERAQIVLPPQQSLVLLKKKNPELFP